MHSNHVKILGVCLAVTCGLAMAATARASTAVPGGVISTDTTWTLAGSPYIVTGAVQVKGTDGSDGVTTLTIEPGVEVRFNLDCYLLFGSGAPGALLADGDAAGGPATIVFTANTGSPTRGFWRGLRFADSAQSSTIRHATVAYGGRVPSNGDYPGSIWSRLSVGVLTLDNVTIRESDQAGPTPVTLQYCTEKERLWK